MGSTSGRSWRRARETLLQAQRRSPPSLVRFAVAVVRQMQRLEPFDRAMTLAAQAFTSLFPLIIAVALFLFRPTPQPQIIYIPVEVAAPQGGGLGCLPVIIIGIILLLALGVIRF